MPRRCGRLFSRREEFHDLEQRMQAAPRSQESQGRLGCSGCKNENSLSSTGVSRPVPKDLCGASIIYNARSLKRTGNNSPTRSGFERISPVGYHQRGSHRPLPFHRGPGSGSTSKKKEKRAAPRRPQRLYVVRLLRWVPFRPRGRPRMIVRFSSFGFKSQSSRPVAISSEIPHARAVKPAASQQYRIKSKSRRWYMNSQDVGQCFS